MPHTRLSDFGTLQIESLNAFLETSRKRFYDNWKKPFLHLEVLNDFKQIQKLGSGSFGDVILIQHKQTAEYYAMKAIEKGKIVKWKQVDHTRNEKHILQNMDFPFVVYLQFFFKDNSYIYMVMPFIPGGELFSYLQKCGKFDETKSKFYAAQVILGFEYLHFLDLVYRDLKPENIMVDHTGYLKITDFGFCKMLIKHRTYTFCGTPEYLAPEVILGKGYGKAVDWWGIGVLIFEMSAGNPPFFDKEQMRIYEKIVACKYKMPNNFSPELKDLVQNLLQTDLTRRYGNLKSGVNDIKNHKWFRQTDWLSLLNRKVKAPYMPKYKKPGDTTNFDDQPWEAMRVSKSEKYLKEFSDF